MTAPYRYHTLDDSACGASHARARQDAAGIARRTGQTVELIDPARGVFHIQRLSAKRAQWLKVSDVGRAA